MKIYTKKGDKGETQLIGKRVKKTHERVEAYGSIDELNSFIGVAVAEIADRKDLQDVKNDLLKIQHELFDLGGDLANVTGKVDWATKEEYVNDLEEKIDHYCQESPDITKFILPGGQQAAAHLHVCRTVTRRAERTLLKIDEDETLPPVAVKYVNRLSDYFFAAARVINYRLGTKDVLYERGKDVFS
ncbi:cob(I)yrinic acid a,c-diamide adenosyltransferase [Bacillus shivajii]|uniref:cob(I)yrinic acid a,c-diamide adenosyltransferase n=1 Tax=Bacillus shivajii TaxID=1983719 RepID=UPI001CFB4942|nr:cob(I)yrinic acid a,c-diamide adenosyltransferase [Bacillus shivajii]UCZ54730.1 cob(I)yrinic acid a,c-diamide adenosyltransferase [Bacillus shivajii]